MTGRRHNTGTQAKRKPRAELATWFSVLLLLLECGSGFAQIPCRYEVSAIIQAPSCGILGFPPTIGNAISPNGRWVVGYYYYCITNGIYKAFVYDTQSHQFTTLPFPAGVDSAMAHDVNDAGLAVGHVDGPGFHRGFIYNISTGEYEQLLASNISSGRCVINAINADGMVCGFREVEGPPLHRTTAFTWTTRSEFIELGLIARNSTSAIDLNNSGAVTGTMFVNNIKHSFLWFNRMFIDLGTLAGLATDMTAINAANHTVGRSRFPVDGVPVASNRAVLWTPENGIKNLGTLPGHNLSVALAIGDNDMVVGLSSTLGQSNGRGFVWRNGLMRDLNDLILNGDIAQVSEAAGIDAQGTIISGAEDTRGSVVTIVLVAAIQIVGDVDANCRVNVDDLLWVINEWGQPQSPADINGDGMVNVQDLSLVIVNWSST